MLTSVYEVHDGGIGPTTDGVGWFTEDMTMERERERERESATATRIQGEEARRAARSSMSSNGGGAVLLGAGLFVLLLVPIIPPRSRGRREGSPAVSVPLAISIECANNLLYQTETAGTHRFSLVINLELYDANNLISE